MPPGVRLGGGITRRGVSCASGSVNTTYLYTGQKDEPSFGLTGSDGLYFYNSRWYDPYLNRFTQPDSIIPDQYNPQDWDRYSYCRNNPLKYTDPTGYDPLADWELQFHKDYDRNPTDTERQDFLFSLMFLGSGKNGQWTADDWEYYNDHRQDLWEHPGTWLHPDASGVEGFAVHSGRLASQYKDSEKSQFMRAFGLVFAGIPYDRPWFSAAWSVRHGPHDLTFLNESNQGMSSGYLDSDDIASNQSHHFVGLMFQGFYSGYNVAALINRARDSDNPGDINLGNVGAMCGAVLHSNGMSLQQLQGVIFWLQIPTTP
jgi:RHS repeat-associated protein